jgi:hypothetical protein
MAMPLAELVLACIAEGIVFSDITGAVIGAARAWNQAGGHRQRMPPARQMQRFIRILTIRIASSTSLA